MNNLVGSNTSRYVGKYHEWSFIALPLPTEMEMDGNEI